MSDEKRTFSRVPVRLKGYARIMRSIESTPMYIGDGVGDAACCDTMFKGSKLPEEVTNFLMEMNRKLDRVLGLMSQGNLRDDFPIDLEILELSGAGIKFRSQTSFALDTPLEVIIILGQVPLKMAGSKGRILGVEDDTKLYRFEFVDTLGSNMEAIVQFVFQQQRELIRKSKM
jgi:hypothetical protein